MYIVEVVYISYGINSKRSPTSDVQEGRQAYMRQHPRLKNLILVFLEEKQKKRKQVIKTRKQWRTAKKGSCI